MYIIDICNYIYTHVPLKICSVHYSVQYGVQSTMNCIPILRKKQMEEKGFSTATPKTKTN